MLSLPEDLRFVEVIEPTTENATAIQRLVLQDLRLGKFPKPLKRADPSNPKKVEDQRLRLQDNPERYHGYMRGGELVAFIKEDQWLVSAEIPHATGEERDLLEIEYKRDKSATTGQWGIFGLVASDDLDEAERDEVLADLLTCTFTDPATGNPRVVNIVVHDQDPLLKILPHCGFVVVGVRGEAPGAKGLKQPRYQRPAWTRS